MKVFDFKNYRAFIRHRVESAERGGHGQYRKMAEHLGLPNSLLSHVMAEKRELSAESACLLCEYFALNDTEAEYFVTMVELERAGSPALRARKRKQLETLAKRGNELNQRLAHERRLSEEEKSTFYSQWHYSGIRLLTSVEGRNSVDALAQALRLPRATVASAMEFLLSTGLCVEQKGKIRLGPMSTHVGNESPMVMRHHVNWRMKLIGEMSRPRSHEVVFTGPAVISHEACLEIKKMILDLLDRWGSVVDAAPAEKLVCLNIDWREVD